MYKLYTVILFLLGLSVLSIASSNPDNSEKSDSEYTVTVSAGDFDRSHTIVSFSLPLHFDQGVYRMIPDDGSRPVDLQVDDNSKGWFVLEALNAGEMATYTLRRNLSSDHSNDVTYDLDDNTITYHSGGKEVFSYYHSAHVMPDHIEEVYSRGGYFYPVRSPGGVVLTGRLEGWEGHLHSVGLFAGWNLTQFEGRAPDFWAPQQGTGRIRTDSIKNAWQGAVHGGFRARNRYIDLSGSGPVTAVNEQWEALVYHPSAAGSRFHVFDITNTQTTNTEKPITLKQHHYGGYAFRGHDDLQDPDKLTIFTSEGYNREEGNETRARWVHFGGLIEGRRAGIAVLGHPDNVRHPQPVRIHPDKAYFTFAPVQLGDIIIEPGSPMKAKFRYVTYDGEPDPEVLDRLWNDFAYPPGVTVAR